MNRYNMSHTSLLTLISCTTNQKQTLVLSKQKRIHDLKFIIAKRMLTTQNNVFIYKDKNMTKEYDSKSFIGNTKVFYFYCEPYEPIQEPKLCSFLCCIRQR